MLSSKTIDRPSATTSIHSHSVQAKIDADAAKRLANRFILENLPDRFCAGTPRFLQFPLQIFWVVPVVLSYPRIGPIGETGVVTLDIETGAVVGWTPLDEMKQVAETIYEAQKKEIEAAFLQTRNT